MTPAFAPALRSAFARHGVSLLAYALAVRAVFVWSLGERFHDPAVLSLMPLSTAIAHGRWPDGGLGPSPMVPLLLAAGQWLAGDHFRLAARGLLAIVGLGTVALVGALARGHPDHRSRDRALLLAACSPMLVLAGGSFSVPGVSAALLSAAVVAGTRALRTDRRAPLVAFAVLAPAAALANPMTLWPLTALLAWWAHGRWRHRSGSRAARVALVASLLTATFAFAPVEWLAERRADSEAATIARALARFGSNHPALVAAPPAAGPALPERLARLAVRFVMPLSYGSHAHQPLHRAQAWFVALSYLLPLTALAVLGLVSKRVPRESRVLIALLAFASFAGGAAHGVVLEARVLATPFWLVAATWGWPELRERWGEHGSVVRRSLGVTVAFRLGAALFAITTAGLVVPLRNPEIYGEPLASRWSRLEFTESQVHAVAAEPFEDRRAFLERLNRVVHGSLQHYWSPDGADRYSIRVPLHENWLLHLASWLDPVRFGLYEFVDYRRALARGVGLCSQHAIVAAGLLQARGIPARVVRLGGHVVLEARADDATDAWWVLDPDFGVVLHRSLAGAQADTGAVRAAYAAAGYSDTVAAEIAALYDPRDNRTFADAAAYAGPRRALAERGTYVAIWVLPLLLALPFALASLRGASDTAPEA